jgi:hypothetical protein
MRLDWGWIGWQVGAPLLGPPGVGLLVVVLWRVAGNEARIDWSVLADLTPWALLTYALSLVATTLRLREARGWLFWVTAFLALVALLLYAFILQRRLDGAPVAEDALWLSAILVAATVVLCYLQRQVRKE